MPVSELMAPGSAFKSQIELCSSPEAIEREILRFHAGMSVTHGHHESVVPGRVNDIEWNSFDLWHRIFVHNTYLESMNVMRGRHFAVQLTRLGRLPIYTMVSNAKIAPGLLYQSMEILGIIYCHQVAVLVQEADQVRIVIDWYTASHKLFRFLHGFFNRRLLALQRKQDGEDLQIRSRRWELRQRGVRFTTDDADYINSNILTDNVVLPAAREPTRARLPELPPGRVERIAAGPIELLVERVAEGIKVLPGICPHEGAPMEACHRRDDGVLHCPWHGRRFRAATLGPSSPSWSFLGFTVRLEGDELVVSDTRTSLPETTGANGTASTSVREPAAIESFLQERTNDIPRLAVASPPPQAPAGEVDITLFVACYNEEENIEATLDTVFAAIDEVGCSHEILIIDDASRDGTVERIQEYQRNHPTRPIRLIVNEVNRGLANNYIEGAFRGRGKYYRLVCGDDAEPKETFLAVLRNLGKADMIIPYQTACHGKPPFRRFLSRTYTFLVNVISGHRIRYYNGLPVHYRADVMRWHSRSRGFGFQADLVTRLLDQGASYIEIPVISQDRKSAAGKSKALTLRNVLSVAHVLAELFLRRLGNLVYGRRALPARRVSADQSTCSTCP